MRIWSFKCALSPTFIIALIVVLGISILSVNPMVISTAENYKKGNNIAGGTISSYTNFNPATQGNEKDGARSTYLQGGWTTAGNQICTLDIENYKTIYSIYWKVGRTLWGSINETCYLYIHEIDGWHTIDERSLGPSEGFEQELELNGQSIDEVQFYGVSRKVDLQWAQWWVYEIEIYEALPWPPLLVSISPSSQEGAPGETLSYTVTVKNPGTENDTYNLTVSDNENWSPALDDTRFDNIAPDENRITTLRVTISDNAVPGAIDNIKITATSQADNTVSDNASCFASVVPARIYLLIGWNLVCFTAAGATDTPNNLFAPLVYSTDYVMYYWNAPGGPYSQPSPTAAVQDNRGYWVNMITTAKTVITTGTKPVSRDIHLIMGWNLVGFPIVDATTTPNKIFAPLVYVDNYVMFYWVASGGPYSQPNPGTALKDNIGYWVWVDQDKTLTVP